MWSAGAGEALADLEVAQHGAAPGDRHLGGDEFVVLVFGGSEAATEVADRFHGAVRAASWGLVAPGLEVTVSVGVGRPVPAQGAIAAADAALHAAKRAGRDRIVTV